MSKTSLHVNVEQNLKEKVGEKIEYSEMSFSDLAESALQNFLRNYDERVECQCGARFHLNVLVKSDGDCPSCGEKVRI